MHDPTREREILAAQFRGDMVERLGERWRERVASAWPRWTDTETLLSACGWRRATVATVVDFLHERVIEQEAGLAALGGA